MLRVSKISFPSQLRKIPNKFKKIEAKAIRLILSGPGNWVPCNMAHFLDSQCHFPISIKNFKVLNESVLLKTGLITLTGWQGHWQRISDAKLWDGSNLIHPMAEWVEGTSIFNIVQAQRDFDMTAFLGSVVESGLDINKPISKGEIQKAIYAYKRHTSIINNKWKCGTPL